MAYQPSNPPSPLARGVVTGAPIVSGGTYVYDVEVSGTDWLVVQVELVGSAVGDLGLTVLPFEDDGLTLSPIGLLIEPDISRGPVVNGAVVNQYAKYNVTGIGRVRITVTNNNAATKVLNRLSWRTRGY